MSTRIAPKVCAFAAALALALAAARPAAAQNLSELEPNDFPGDFGVYAFPLGASLNGDLSGASFNDDYWQFSVVGGQQVRFQSVNVNCSGIDPMDIALAVVDASLTVYAVADFTGTCQQETLDFTAPFSGTFFLDIYDSSLQPTNGITQYRVNTYDLSATPSPTASLTPAPTASLTPSPSPSPSPTPYQNQGSGRDVPTWEIGDHWDYNRTFTLDLDLSTVLSQGLGFPVVSTATIDMADSYRLTVSAIQDEMTTISGIPTLQRVYVRDRSNASVQGGGTLFLGGTPFASLDFPTTGSLADTGEVWTRASDLADAHEQFRLNATMDATFLTTTSATPQALAIFDLTLNMDHDPPMEAGDFPLDIAGEQWITNLNRRIWGTLSADFPTLGSTAPGLLVIPAFGTFAAPADLTFPLEKTAVVQANKFYLGPDAPRQGYNPTYHVGNQIAPPLSEDHWYSPGAKEFVERTFPPIQLSDASSSVTATVRNLRTVVVPSSASVSTDSIGSIVFTPYRPATGAPFSASGVVSPAPPSGTTVTAKVLDTGAMGTGMTNGSGGFTISLTAPPADDFSPASEDGGSFGVEFTVTGFPYRKVASVQISGAGISPVKAWEGYD